MTEDILMGLLANLIVVCIFIVVFVVIPFTLNHLYKTPNLRDFRICRRLDGNFVVMAKNKLGFWRLLHNMCNMGYLFLRGYEGGVFVCVSYRKESMAEDVINDIVDIIKNGKIKESNKLETIKKIKV